MAKIKNIDELFDMIFAEMDADDISKELSAAARRKKEREEKEEREKRIKERKKEEICNARVRAVDSYVDYFKLLSPDLFNKKDIETIRLALLRELSELEEYFKDI